jgi:hypothetical protein
MPDTERTCEALEVGTQLHHLALMYWSEGRPDDASRVGHQAARILERECPGSALLAEVRSTVGEIELERGKLAS